LKYSEQDIDFTKLKLIKFSFLDIQNAHGVSDEINLKSIWVQAKGVFFKKNLLLFCFDYITKNDNGLYLIIGSVIRFFVGGDICQQVKNCWEMQQCDCHGEKTRKNTTKKTVISIMLRYLQIALSLLDRLTC
jgi:GH18 family chitinase